MHSVRRPLVSAVKKTSYLLQNNGTVRHNARWRMDSRCPSPTSTPPRWAVVPNFGKSPDDAGWFMYVLWRITLMLKILKVAASTVRGCA